jgi:outer membrane protein assembly factor BamB
VLLFFSEAAITYVLNIVSNERKHCAKCKISNIFKKVKKMEKSKKTYVKLAMAFLTVLLLSTMVTLVNSAVIKDSIQSKPLSPATNYGDILQYDWPMSGHDEGQTGFNPGPGPDTPNVMWKIALPPSTGFFASGFVTVFNSKAFIVSGNVVQAVDAFTGALIWNTTLKGSADMNGGASKIDDTYFFVDCQGPEVHKISDGSYVANYTVPFYGGHPGSAQYFPGAYSSTLKMKFVLSYDTVQKVGLVNAISLADPTHPTLAWTYTVEKVSEIQGYGNGRLYVGTTGNTLYALNATTGDFLWEAPKTGVVQQQGMYYDGNFYQAASTQCMTCWDGTTGDVLWEYDASVLGERAYFAYRGAAGYGRIYDCAIPNDPNGWVVCWDAQNGDLLWKQPAYYNIAYNTVAMADGKVYAETCDQAAGSVTAGLEMPGYEFSCFDAYTGEQLWKISGIAFSIPMIAYGNLYGTYNGYVYCIGDSTPTSTSAQSWAFGYSGNVAQPRVAVGQAGPSDLSHPRWVYATEGKISGSPAIVDGKVYIGSEDRNWYCLDAYSGAKLWNYTVGYAIGSSAAVVGGRVYTGADDGNIYCLDANSGTKIWSVSAGGLFDHILMPQELQSRSSPIIVGDLLYVGALDGKVYCLNTADGSQKWVYTTGGAVGGSPAYANGVIYITSTDTYMYALNAADGSLKWKSIPLNLDVGVNPVYSYFCTGTPVVANGVVYVPGGVTYGIVPDAPFGGGAFGGGMRLAAFNANTGASIWNQTIAGNSGGVWMPTYYNGMVYFPENMRVSAINATNPNSGPIAVVGFLGQAAGNRTWSQWIGYQILASVAYADDIRGAKVYIGSDVGSVTCLNATDGKSLSAFQTGANVEGSPSIWDGKLYIGGTDRNVYCFDDSPQLSTTLVAESNKGGEMWSNETVVIRGHLLSNPDEMTWQGVSYVAVPSEMHPAIPNAQIIVSFNKPDGSSVNVTAVTDNYGAFEVSYDPNVVGSWGWVAYYEGMVRPGISYVESYSDWQTLNVISPSSGSSQPAATVAPASPAAVQSNPANTNNIGGLPMEWVYAIVAVVIIVVVAVGAYAYTRRGKK